MKVQSVLALLAATKLTTSLTVDRSLTNGWGSTPSERHYINQTQALTALNAGIARATELG